jgi:hypothetical protein
LVRCPTLSPKLKTKLFPVYVPIVRNNSIHPHDEPPYNIFADNIFSNRDLRRFLFVKIPSSRFIKCHIYKIHFEVFIIHIIQERNLFVAFGWGFSCSFFVSLLKICYCCRLKTQITISIVYVVLLPSFLFNCFELIFHQVLSFCDVMKQNKTKKLKRGNKNAAQVNGKSFNVT